MRHQLGPLATNGLPCVALNRGFPLRRVTQCGTHTQESSHAAFNISRDAQVLKGIRRVFAHAHQIHCRALWRCVHFHGQHVVVELFGLAGGIAQLVAHAGADVAQFFLRGGFISGPQARINRLSQIDLANINAPIAGSAQPIGSRKIFNVDDAQRGVFKCELFCASALTIG